MVSESRERTVSNRVNRNTAATNNNVKKRDGEINDKDLHIVRVNVALLAAPRARSEQLVRCGAHRTGIALALAIRAMKYQALSVSSLGQRVRAMAG